MKQEWLRNRMYGIQKKLLLYTMALVVFMLGLFTLTVNVMFRKYIKENLLEQYGYVNDKFYRSFQGMYENLEGITEVCITNSNVQNSLKNKELSVYDREVISKTLQFVDETVIHSYLYLDNKAHVYTRNHQRIEAERLKDSPLYQELGEDYSKVKLFWEQSIFSEQEEKALYAARYVRQMERQYQPGIIFLQIRETVFKQMVEQVQNEHAAFFLIDSKGQICFEMFPSGQETGNGWRTAVKNGIQAVYQEEPQVGAGGVFGRQGLSFIKNHPESGFSVAVFVPNQTLYQVIWQMNGILLLVLIVVLAVAFVISRVMVRNITRPMRFMSQLMESFDDTKLNSKAVLHTNTELDAIGDSYNKMLVRISQLMKQVTYKERELRKAELDTMMYQIRPHFLYNTLDTIYMLARISKEETIMQMVAALSKYLRINLSNGAEEITIEEELMHVKAYIEIQNIRNSGLLHYNIMVAEGLKQIPIVKMILQPIVENCIKHAFEGQLLEIGIFVERENESIVFRIENDGELMQEKDRVRLNRLEKSELRVLDAMVTASKRGYGVYHVVKRLRLRYHEQIRFYYEVSNKKTTCVIEIKEEWMGTDATKIDLEPNGPAGSAADDDRGGMSAEAAGDQK